MQYNELPVYTSWERIPSGLCTKTQLLKERLVLPEDAQPLGYKKSTMPVRYYALYPRECAVEMPAKQERQPRDYVSIFVRRYVSKRDAYLAACEALFSLNRYAKHESCSDKHKKTIYALKSAWIRCLYEQGFCVDVFEAKTPERAGLCFRCSGEGFDEFGEECYKCGGTGEYRSGGRVYWSFRFLVDGKSFAWHQPAPLSFVVTPTRTDIEHEVIAEEKPILLAQGKMAEAKALIAWCLSA